MEDYSPSSDEVEETPLQKRRFLRGNFLRSWLDRRDDDSEQKTATDESDSGHDKAWRPGRLSDRLQKIFDSLIGLELIPQKETADSPEDDRQDLPVSAESTQAPQEEGVLAVSPDAQLRYYGYELMDEPGLSDEEAEPEVEVDDIETDHPIEIRQAAMPGNSGGREQRAGVSTAEPVGEVLRRRQTDKLEKKVKRLKKQTKTIKKEQAEVVERQKDFAEQMAEQQKAQERFQKVTVPKMEKAREKLQERLDRTSQAVKTESSQRPTAELGQNRPVEVKTELYGNFLPEQKSNEAPKKTTNEIKPEELAISPEHSVGHKIISEKLFERRHEVMDRADSAKVDSSRASIDTNRLGPAPIYPPPILPAAHRTSSPAPIYNPQMATPQAGTSMYKQAMKTGFWSGIGLTAILLLVLIFMR
ncbi:MAG: hypothetical protein ACXWLH_01125 [Candidatus Saccharimonadales bacterium]